MQPLVQEPHGHKARFGVELATNQAVAFTKISRSCSTWRSLRLRLAET